MILTITVNPAIDKTIVVEHFVPNAVNRVKTSREDLGGKGINVSKVLAKLQVPTVACGFIGRHNYSQVAQFVEQEQLATDFVLVDGLTRTNTKIVDESSQLTTDVNEPGFKISSKEFNQLKTLIESVAADVSIVVFSGSLCQGLSLEQYGELIRTAKHHTSVVVDAEKQTLKEALSHAPLLVKPNVNELEEYLGEVFETENQLIKAGQNVLKNSGTHMMLLSHGSQGAYFITNDVVLKAEAIKVHVKSSVGAGDSMLAGFLSEYVQGHHVEEALRVATVCGALAVSQEGTQSFTHDEVNQLKHKVKIETLTGR